MSISDWVSLGSAAVCLAAIVVLMLIPSPEEKDRWWKDKCRESREKVLTPFWDKYVSGSPLALPDDWLIHSMEFDFSWANRAKVLVTYSTKASPLTPLIHEVQL